jgi:peptidoglycan/xylan/chitin deacetylase (PgdA/CDA1 family)
MGYVGLRNSSSYLDRMNLKQAGRTVLFRLLGLLGVGRLLHALNRRAGRIPVVVFHRVSPHPDPFWPPYTPEEFRRLIAFLAKRYRFITLDDLLTRSTDELRDAIVITFDDVWRDFVDHALPILREHRVPVAQFVATEAVAQRTLIWTSLLDQAFRRTKARTLEFTLEGQQHQFAMPDEATRVRAADQVQRLFKRLPDTLRQHALEAILDKLGRPAADPHKRLCTWDDLRTLHTEVPLHAHSATHPYLPLVEEDAQLEAELAGCQRILNAELGITPRYLAYPMGGHDARVEARSAQLYEAAFATGNALVELGRLRLEPEYRYRIPRFNLTDTAPHEAYLRLNGFHGWLLRLAGRSA